MNFFKNVWADLVERRLWPVAVGLAVALVALPVLLGRSGSGSSAGSAPLPTAATNGTPAAQLVSLSTLKPKGAPLGPRHNPFRNTSGAPAPATPSDATSPTVSATASAGGNSGGLASSGSSGPSVSVISHPDTSITAPTPPASTPPASTPPASTPIGEATPRSYAAGYRVDVTYGHAGSNYPHNDLARLDPLSALKAPLVLFLGVKDDRASAIFMVLGDVSVTGDGDCRPSAADCQVFGLKQGDAELLDVASNGRSLRYELQVDKVSPRTVKSFRASVHYRHRESSAGRSLLQKAIASTRNPYVAKYRYALGKGVVTKVMPRAAAK